MLMRFTDTDYCGSGPSMLSCSIFHHMDISLLIHSPVGAGLFLISMLPLALSMLQQICFYVR